MFNSFLFALAFMLLLLLMFFCLMSKLLSKPQFELIVQSYYKWGIFIVVALLMMLLVFDCNNGGSIVVSMSTNWFLSHSIALVLDPYSLFFFLSALIVSWSIMKFSVDYMVAESGVSTFLFMLLVFLLFMFVLVFSYNFLMLFVGWEGVSFLSYILISWWSSRYEAVTGAMQAVIYNRVSDAGLMFFLVIALVSLSELLMWNFFLYLFFLLFLMGVVAKSSQVFFHPWLPNAMEGPTPVSSLLHSSTMVVAGVYLMMRFLDVFSFTGVVFFVGLMTCLLGGFMGFNSFDFKKVVAYSTTSQLSFMMMMLGLKLNVFCLLYIGAHAFFKAMIFMMSGVVIHMQSGGQDFRSMSNMVGLNKFLFLLFMLGSLVMMSLPYVSGFWIKDLVIESMLGSNLNFWICCLSMFAVVITGMYSTRLFLSIFMVVGDSQSKKYIWAGMNSVYPFMRLLLGSVVAGLIFYVCFNTLEHSVLYLLDKVFPLVFFLVGGMVSVFVVYFIKKTFFPFFSYLLNYNPMVHKWLSDLMYSAGYLINLLDFILVEYVFNGGLIYLRVSMTNKFFFFLVLMTMLIGVLLWLSVSL